MTSEIDKVLTIKDPTEYSNIRLPETLFHDALGAGKLDAVVKKFPGCENALATIHGEVLSFEPLGDGWHEALLGEVQQLVALIPEGRVPSPVSVQVGQADYDTDEMFTLRGELNRAIRKYAGALDPHERAFLNEFYFGIDYSHWTKWAVFLRHTELEASFPTIIRARRSDIDFALHGDALIVSA